MASADSETSPQMEKARRASRPVKIYNEDSDGLEDSDPDQPLSDSDDDPDFNADKKGGSDDEDYGQAPKRGRGRGRGGAARGRGRGVKRPLKEKAAKTTPSKRGRGASNRGKGKHGATNGSGEGAGIKNQFEDSQDDGEVLPKFKSGEFLMLKTDQEKEHPPIWKIDKKSLLEKFQAFEKDGKTLYRNACTYSGWKSESKSLYIGVKTKCVFQSRTDTAVEMTGFKPERDDDDVEDDDDDEDDEDEDEDVSGRKRDKTFLNWLKGKAPDAEDSTEEEEDEDEEEEGEVPAEGNGEEEEEPEPEGEGEAEAEPESGEEKEEEDAQED